MNFGPNGRYAPLAAWVVLLTTINHAAYGELILNGDFEEPIGTCPVKTTTNLPGWTVYGNVDIIPLCKWQAAEGSQSIDLVGIFAPGNYIEQTFATSPGDRYLLSFYYANNSDCAWAEGNVHLAGANTLLDLNLWHSNSTPAYMNYVLFQQTFIADSATTALRFTHLDSPFPDSRGLALDGVSVIPFACPSLSIQRAGTNVVVSWPESGSNAVLRATDAVAPSIVWTNVPDTPILVGNQYVVTNAITPARRFYQLECR